MRFDKNVVVLYGDPAWVVRMADRPKAYEQKLVEKDGVYSFVVRGQRGDKSFQPINTNGAQRGWRPIVEMLPFRLTNIEILEDGGLSPVVADDFILVPNPRKYDPSRTYEIKFRAKRLGAASEAETAANR